MSGREEDEGSGVKCRYYLVPDYLTTSDTDGISERRMACYQPPGIQLICNLLIGLEFRKHSLPIGGHPVQQAVQIELKVFVKICSSDKMF